MKSKRKYRENLKAFAKIAKDISNEESTLQEQAKKIAALQALLADCGKKKPVNAPASAAESIYNGSGPAVEATDDLAGTRAEAAKEPMRMPSPEEKAPTASPSATESAKIDPCLIGI